MSNSEDQMRILIDLTSLADNFSGIERFAACLANEMIKDSSNQYILLFKEKIHPIFYKQKKKRPCEDGCIEQVQ